ncbi:fructosamine kinase family protein [Sporolactobacillus sp. THM7-7]|nr:fructosamine kinase family protein [Sporolactobacillus sp. THM7-7]
MLTDDWFQSLPIQPINRITAVPGGDINEAFALDSRDSRYFLKVHQHTEGNFFTQEARGLKWIGKAARTPRVIAVGEIGGKDYLILQWIARSSRRNDRKLGQALARVHRITASAFGFDANNFAGQLPQYNEWETDWAAFYLRWRLTPQIEIAKKRGRWNLRREKKFERLSELIKETYRDLEVTPSLLHGDLWSGNVMFADEGEPVLIDPSIFFGNREMDIAMSRLFGGFRPDFYQAYLSDYPLDPGWQERMPWYQLYYLLCHLNMFGEGYGAAVERALEG